MSASRVANYNPDGHAEQFEALDAAFEELLTGMRSTGRTLRKDDPAKPALDSSVKTLTTLREAVRDAFVASKPEKLGEPVDGPEIDGARRP